MYPLKYHRARVKISYVDKTRYHTANKHISFHLKVRGYFLWKILTASTVCSLMSALYFLWMVRNYIRYSFFSAIHFFQKTWKSSSVKEVNIKRFIYRYFLLSKQKVKTNILRSLWKFLVLFRWSQYSESETGLERESRNWSWRLTFDEFLHHTHWIVLLWQRVLW